MRITQRLTPCLWFDGQAEEAARFYTSIFKNSKINLITRFSDVGFEQHHGHASGGLCVVLTDDSPLQFREVVFRTQVVVELSGAILGRH